MVVQLHLAVCFYLIVLSYPCVSVREMEVESFVCKTLELLQEEREAEIEETR